MFKVKPQYALHVFVSMLLVIALLNACSQPAGVPTLDEDGPPLFTSDDLSKAIPVKELSNTTLVGVSLNNEMVARELPYVEVDDSQLATQAVLPNVEGWLVLIRSSTTSGEFQIRRYDQATDNGITVWSSSTLKAQSVAVDGSGNRVVASIINPTTGSYDVYLFVLSTGNMFNLTNTSGKDEFDVSITKDGNTIVYGREHSSGKLRPYICEYNNNPSNPGCNLSNLSNFRDQYQPSISANGEYLAMIEDRPNNRYRVRVYKFSTGTYTEVQTRGDVLSDPSVDDTGEKVMYARKRSGGTYSIRLSDTGAGTVRSTINDSNLLEHAYITAPAEHFVYGLLSPSSNTRKARTRDLMTNDFATPQGGAWNYYQSFWMWSDTTAPMIPANVIVVDKDATGDETGDSWVNAYTSLQDALGCVNNGNSNDAHCNGRTFDDAGVDEIWVASGTYYPDEAVFMAVTNNSATEKFSLNQSGVKIFGGFDGVGSGGTGGAQESERSQRNSDPMTNGTVLSGDIDQNDPVEGHSGLNARRVVQFVTNFETLSDETLIDGFKIEKGYTESTDGAGLFCDGIVNGKFCNASFKNLYFYNNRAAGNDGGAMYLENGIPGNFSDMIFFKNSATNGGAIYMKDFDFGSNTTNPGGNMNRLGFYSNSAFAVGGAIHAVNSKGTGGLINSVFSKNGAFNAGGAIYITFTFQDTGHRWNIYNNTFHDNDVTLAGGAVYVNTTNSTITGRVASLSSNMFTNNDAQTGGEDLHTLLESASSDVFFNHNRVTGNGSGAPATDAIVDAGNGSTFIPSPPSNIFSGGAVYVDSNGADNVLGTPDDNFQLLNCYEGIDAGASNNGVTGTDFAGNPRNVAGCNGIGIDIGAYEYQP